MSSAVSCMPLILQRRGRVPDRYGHPREHAQPALIVGDLYLPHPFGAAAMLARGLGVDRAARDRAQEACLVRETHRLLAIAPHRERCTDRSKTLGDRRVDAAMDKPRELLELVAHDHPPAHQLVGYLDHLE